MSKLMGNSEFKRKVTAFYSTAKITGPMLQELIEDGLLQADHPSNGGHGSLNRLTMVIQACRHVKTVPTRTIQRYIQQHIDAKWCKLDGESYGFKFNNGAGSTMPNVPWYDWEGNTENKPKIDVDVVTRLKSLVTQAKNAEKKGGKVEHSDILPEIEAILKKHTEAA